jgi:hypothetical protein
MLESVYIELKNITPIDEDIETKMSPPLLIKPTEKWFESSKKILVVGQETLEWKKKGIESFSDYRMLDTIAKLQDAYDKFCFAETSKKHKHSPFWRAYRAIRNAFDSCDKGIETNVLWTNLYKCSNNGKSWYGKKDANDRRESVEKALQGILWEEIKILEPTDIIFFTGPRYDRYLKQSLNGNVEFAPIDDRYSTRQLAKFCINEPSIPGFRTYHPNYLQRSKNWQVIDLLVKELGCNNK